MSVSELQNLIGRPSRTGEPTWEMARYFPYQGDWTEADYLALRQDRGVELIDGRLEFLPRPTRAHQVLLFTMLKLFDAFIQAGASGLLLPAGYRVRMASGRFREPDLVYYQAANVSRCRDDYGEGADLVLEIVSPDAPERDWIAKRRDYADAGIGEYWIIDPPSRTITVLRLENGAYVEHARGGEGEVVASALLPGFSVDVRAVFASVPQ